MHSALIHSSRVLRLRYPNYTAKLFSFRQAQIRKSKVATRISSLESAPDVFQSQKTQQVVDLFTALHRK